MGLLWRFLPQEHVLLAVLSKKKHAICPWGIGVWRSCCAEEQRKGVSIRRPENILIINQWRGLFASKLLPWLVECGQNGSVRMDLRQEFSRMSIVHVDETRHVPTRPLLAIPPVAEHGPVLVIRRPRCIYKASQRILFKEKNIR